MDDYEDDIDDNYYDDEEDMAVSRKTYMDIMHSVSRHSVGISFVLLMEHKVQGHSGYDTGHRDYSVHPRFDQPCQGGETRKYESHNPGDCTQPHNSKPGDLYHPFPDGRPSAIAFPLTGHKNATAHTDLFLRRMISADSPWFKGFGGTGNVEFLVDDKNQAYGYIIGKNNLDIDPTIMINMINTIRNTGYAEQQYNELLANGLTHWEAVAVLMLNSNHHTMIVETSTYYFPMIFSAKRFFGQMPNDLSGGYYSDRTDYNRTYISDVFLGEESEGCVSWDEGIMGYLKGKTKGKDYTSSYGGPQVSCKDLAEAAKAFFAEQLSKEEIVVKPYVYRDTYGNEKPTPIIISQQAELKEAA